MVELRVVALGITAALQARGAPDPLGVDLKCLPPSQAAYLIEAVIEECRDAGVALARVRVDPCVAVAVAVAMRQPGCGYCERLGDIVVEVCTELFQRVEFHRSGRAAGDTRP